MDTYTDLVYKEQCETDNDRIADGSDEEDRDPTWTTMQCASDEELKESDEEMLDDEIG